MHMPRQKNTINLAIAIVILCLVMIFVYLISIGKISKIYIDETKTTIYDLKKEFMWETVNNLILVIDSDRVSKSKNAEELVCQIV